MEKQLIDTDWNSEKWGYSNSYLIFRKKYHTYKLYIIKTDSLSWTHKKFVYTRGAWKKNLIHQHGVPGGENG